MNESLRPLLYPIGFIANFLFGSRFFIQWIQSEKEKKSVVPRSFWHISWTANLLMSLHGLIQVQYPICLIQLFNAGISWRNLNLLGQKPIKFKTFVFFMIGLIASITLLFIFLGASQWMRQPALPWMKNPTTPIHFIWHFAGSIGMLLFASRYWIQWIVAEKEQRSLLGPSFWLISSIGALFSLFYAIKLVDPVNILGFSMGLIPYLRNLMLLKKQKASANTSLNQSSVFIFAGEQSGDLLGGQLITAFKQQRPELTLYGVGGPEMEKAGLTITYPMERFQIMGFSDVLKALPRIYGDFQKIKKEILKKDPLGIVLIDYPDFNMRLAKSLRANGYGGKIVHYVCPSVWAWRKKRIDTLAKTLNHLLTILPFEKECFKKTNLPVTYVGHPLVGAIDNYQYDPQFQLPHPLIAIFPGSRQGEIELNLPIQLAAAKKIGYPIAVSVARPNLMEIIKKYTDETILLVPSEKRYELMKAASCALATSGTIILELGLHQVPTVVTYKLAPFNYLLGRYLFRIHLPFYTLVNIISKQEVYPEFIHKKLSAEEIFQALHKLIENPLRCIKQCEQLRVLLKKSDFNTASDMNPSIADGAPKPYHNASYVAAHTLSHLFD